MHIAEQLTGVCPVCFFLINSRACDDREAPQAHVHDGPVRLAVEPRDAPIVLGPQAGRQRRHGVERADGEHVAHARRDLCERHPLQGGRRVEHERPYLAAMRGRLGKHVQDGVEADAAGATATAAHARKIPSAQEALHAWNAAHRLIEVAAFREGELAKLEKLGNDLVGQEAERTR